MTSSGRAARTLAVTGVTTLLALLLPAATAHAEERTVAGGRLDWGIKSSFQSYVTGPIAKGSWSLRGGAATVGGSQFRFHSAQGTYDPDTGAFAAAFSGGVHFTGHRKPDGGNELDLTVSRPTIRVTGGSGTLYADMVSKAKGTGKITSRSQVPLAALDLSGVNMKGGGTPVALNSVPATLTSQGAEAFAGYYAAGTALDPVSLSVDVTSGANSGKPSGKPGDKPADDRDKDKGKDKGDKDKPKNAGRIEDAAVDWGVRRTFREYVSGSIAQGGWKLSDGARDGGALFRFGAGSGTYDRKKQHLDASFTGTVRFTGKHGLDLALSKLAVRVRDGEGTLYADVARAGKTREKTPLVTFAAKELTPENGLLTLTEVPAELTADGAKAFDSMYKAGTDMDPLSLAVALTPDAELPPLPDLGSTAAPTGPAPEASPKTASASAASSPSPALPIGIGAAVLAAAAGAFLVVRRRRTAPTPTTPGTPGTSPTSEGDH